MGNQFVSSCSGTNNGEADAESLSPNHAAALDYAARGWYIYTAFPGTKAKTNLKWRTVSTNSEKQVRHWWAKSPNATICLDCEKSGVAVLDLDQKDGKDGRAARDTLELINGPLPPTLMQRTASGGTHLIFKGKIKTTVGADDYALGEDIDSNAVDRRRAARASDRSYVRH